MTAVRTLRHPVICVVGPTSSGKSALAQALAERRGGAVLSADSMQIYRGMDIGTGKIPAGERTVPHFGLDIAPPGQPFSAALFQRYGREVVESLDERGAPCILCGGTGFYVRAVVDDYDFPAGEQRGNAVRDSYRALVEEKGAEEAWRELEKTDPESAALIHPNDSKRVIRAFELLFEGTSYARQHEKLAGIQPYYPACFVGLAVEPGVLRERIDRRVDSMLEQGLVAEVKDLLNEGFRESLTAAQAIGYKEIVAALDGRMSLEEAAEQIKASTHRYAKRQRTWFRKDERIRWIDATHGDLKRLVREAENALGPQR